MSKHAPFLSLGILALTICTVACEFKHPAAEQTSQALTGDQKLVAEVNGVDLPFVAAALEKNDLMLTVRLPATDKASLAQAGLVAPAKKSFTILLFGAARDALSGNIGGAKLNSPVEGQRFMPRETDPLEGQRFMPGPTGGQRFNPGPTGGQRFLAKDKSVVKTRPSPKDPLVFEGMILTGAAMPVVGYHQGQLVISRTFVFTPALR